MEDKNSEGNSGNYAHGKQVEEEGEDFGLPKVSYNPIKREEQSKSNIVEEPKESKEKKIPKAKAKSKDSENQGAVIAFVIIFFLLAGLGAYLFVFDGWDRVSNIFGGDNTSQMDSQPLVKDTVEEESNNFGGFNEDTTDNNTSDTNDNDFSQPEEDTGPAKITTLKEETGRSYIIINSFLDDDLAMDFAENLKSEGKSSLVLYPEERNQMTRVAIKDYDSFTEAMNKVDSFRNIYGNKTWVLKY